MKDKLLNAAMALSRFCYRIILATLVGAICVEWTIILAYENFSSDARNAQMYIMYNKILAETGQSQDALPMYIVNENIENAYNDGSKIVIYQGLIDKCTDDELALVIGHEIAHGMLGHLGKLNTDVPSEIAVLEANADKMGAVYMMKAGYNVCKGRELFKHWKEENGNALGQSHPDYSYRYAELNIGCDVNE